MASDYEKYQAELEEKGELSLEEALERYGLSNAEANVRLDQGESGTRPDIAATEAP